MSERASERGRERAGIGGTQEQGRSDGHECQLHYSMRARLGAETAARGGSCGCLGLAARFSASKRAGLRQVRTGASEWGKLCAPRQAGACWDERCRLAECVVGRGVEERREVVDGGACSSERLTFIALGRDKRQESEFDEARVSFFTHLMWWF